MREHAVLRKQRAYLGEAAVVEPKERFQVLQTSELFADVPALVGEAMPPTVEARKYTRGPQIFFTNDLTKEINLAGCATATQVSSFVRRPDSIELRTSSPAFGSESGISGKPKSMVEDIAAA